MTPISTLDMLLFTAAGGILAWLGGVLKKWIRDSTGRRRAEVDRVAKLELRNRLLTESLYDHRNQMLKSGQWTRDTLPPFVKDR